MKNWMLAGLMLTATVQLSAQEAYEDRVNRYIEEYRLLAMKEQNRSGIPAAVTLAQGILETEAGVSDLCTQANNHFGIKCKKNWTGETFLHTDDAKDECFRKYGNAKESYTDHSDFLKNNKRYEPLFQIDINDYQGWAHGLKRCGYATSSTYAPKLIKIIEDFNLQHYTKSAAGMMAKADDFTAEVVPSADAPEKDPIAQTAGIQDEEQETAAPTPAQHMDGVTKVNGLRAFKAHRGDVLLEQAIKYNIRYARLLELNDLPDAPLERDMYIYLDKKHVQGAERTHIVQQDETLLQIAQAQGMQLKQLRIFNHLKEGEEPAPGSTLYLQEMAGDKPQTAAGKKKKPAREQAAAATAPSDEYIRTKQVKNAEPVKTPLTAERNVMVQQPVAMAEAAPIPVAEAATEKKETGTEETEFISTRAATEKEQGDLKKEPETEEKETAVNIAREKAVEELPRETEPQDEFSRLKSKMDKVVYAKPVEPEKPADTAVPLPAPTEPDQKHTDLPSLVDGKFYIVQKGDTGFGIAKKFNISMKQLRAWNNLNFEAVKTGQKLQVRE